jgi:hypothetical protein
MMPSLSGGIAMNVRFWLSLLCALLSMGAAPSPSTPQEVVGAFYAASMALPQKGGVPDAASLARLQPYLSPKLISRLIDADKAEQLYAARTKHEVPPLLEGDLFSSLFEGPTRFETAQCKSDAKTAHCSAALRYDDSASKQSTRWSDDVTLIATETGWRIDDIAYGGTWEFMHKGHLTDVLNHAIREADAPLN